MPSKLRRLLKPLVVVACFLLASVSALGAGLPPSSRAEIDSLLKVLGSSGCEFYRNGTWYSAAQAQDHLRMKYEYFLSKDLVANADEFIAVAATKSSMSGQAYQVRCPHQEAQASAVWLGNALRRIRDGGDH
jgi:hypothetical protein